MEELKIIKVALIAFFSNYIFWAFQIISVLTLLYLDGTIYKQLRKLKTWLTKG